MTYAVIGIMTGQHLNMTRNQSSKSFRHLIRLEKKSLPRFATDIRN